MSCSTILDMGDHQIRFKTGWDGEEHYKMGDKLRWQPDPYNPGQGIDGVHEGNSTKDNSEYWVIVRDGIILTALFRRLGTHDAPYVPYEEQMLMVQYRIRPPSYDLWTVEQWADKARRDALYKARRELENANDYGVEQSIGSASARFMRERLHEPGFLRRILPTKNPPDPVVYRRLKHCFTGRTVFRNDVLPVPTGYPIHDIRVCRLAGFDLPKDAPPDGRVKVEIELLGGSKSVVLCQPADIDAEWAE